VPAFIQEGTSQNGVTRLVELSGADIIIKIQITQDVLLTASGEVSLRFIDELLVTVFRSKSSFTHECLHNVIKNSKTKTMGTTSLIQ
jgi:hypothetical protein